MSQHRTRLILSVALTLAGLLAWQAAPVLASDPPEQEITVPTEIGATTSVEWTGTAPPGVNEGPTSDCTATTGDQHTLNVVVPTGVYDSVNVVGTIAITYEGPATDLKFTVVAPDGTVTTNDSGFVDTDEFAGFSNPEPGTYQIFVCAYLSGLPQAYTGAVTFEGQEFGFFTGTPCTAPSEQLTFEQSYIDENRAGGEPITTTLEDGTLLWGSHAGTTHFFGPAAPDPNTAAFLENYEGQTYQYFSEDNGETWEFVERTPINSDPLSGLPNSGFSDPEFAVDAAGNVFISEINLANIAVSKSTDGGRTYTLQNVLAFTSTDRQWMAADEEDVLYMTGNGFGGGTFPSDPVGQLGHFFAKSTDGGVTWSEAITSNPDGVADIKVDPTDGTLYEISATGDGTISMAAFRNIRNETEDFSEPEINVIAENVGYSPIGRLIDPTFDIDSEGNLYIVFSDNGTGARPAGMYYSYSTDRGRTWLEKPIRLDPDERTEIWPWLAVGDPGQVAIAYLSTDAVLQNNNAEMAAPDDEWHVDVLQTANGLGCDQSEGSGFTISRATSEAPHLGTICQGGTACQAMAIDRRLGDYFAIDIDGDGNAYVSVSDTRQGGAVALPLVVRQTGGPKFIGAGQPEPTPEPTVPPAPEPPEPPDSSCLAEASDDDEVRRVEGADRIETAVNVSANCFDAADDVVLARSDIHPDALAASGLAAELDAPLLLTTSDELDSSVGDELERLGAETVYLMGGTEALSEQVAADVEDRGLEVERVGGRERFETAALIADEVVAQGGDVSNAIVALGARSDGRDAWPDAVAAGNLAAAARAPVILTTPDELPAVSQAALDDLLAEGDTVYIAGGTEAVGTGPEQAITDAGYSAERLGGEDRYGTAVAIVEEALEQGAGLQPVVLATGEVFADPLVAGPAARRLGGVLLLVAPDDLEDSQATAEFLEANAGDIDLAILVGGEATISADVADQVATATSSG